MNSTEIFSKALNLVSPWELLHIELKKSSDGKLGLYLKIGFTQGTKFKDSEGNECSVYDTNLREWRHLNFFQHECYCIKRFHFIVLYLPYPCFKLTAIQIKNNIQNVITYKTTE